MYHNRNFLTFSLVSLFVVCGNIELIRRRTGYGRTETFEQDRRDYVHQDLCELNIRERMTPQHT